MYNKRTFLVGEDSNLLAAITATAFADGEVGMFTYTGANVGAAIATSEWPMFIAQKQTGDLSRGTRKSYMISSPGSIKSIRLAAPIAEAPMIKYIGYNGSTGTSLSYDCDADYGIKFTFDSPYVNKFYNKAGGGGLTKTIHIHTDCCTDCTDGCGTAVCYTETNKFVININETEKKLVGVAGSVNNFIYAELVTNGTQTDWTGTATKIYATNGSKYVYFTDNAGAAANGQAFADGQLVGIAGSTYIVEGTGTVVGFYMSTPYQGTSGLVTGGGTYATQAGDIDSATVTSCGIRITGKFLSSTTGCCCFPPYPWDLEGVTFIITNSLSAPLPCTTLDITDSQDLTLGQGTYNQLIYDEMDAYGYSDIREWFKDCAMNVHLPNGGNSYVSYLVSGETYNVIYIDYVLPVDSSLPTLVTNTALSLEIAVPVGTGNLTNIKTMVNLLATAAGLPNI